MKAALAAYPYKNPRPNPNGHYSPALGVNRQTIGFRVGVAGATRPEKRVVRVTVRVEE
jgi:hypothetical protein